MKETKKQEVQKMMFEACSIIQDMEYEILCILEFTVKNNILVDRYNQPVTLNGKYLCYPKETISHKSVRPFDPFFNIGIANLILKQYFKNLYIDSDRELECRNYSLSLIDFFTGKGNITCHFTNNTEVESGYFVNETIKIIDLIYKLENNDKLNTLITIDNYINFIKNERSKQSMKKGDNNVK